MQGVRIPIPAGPPQFHTPQTVLRHAGEYYGPIVGLTGDMPAVFFIPPWVEVKQAQMPSPHQFGHVTSPPHTFIEESDGTLTIAEAVGSGLWQARLTKGVWYPVVPGG